MATMTEQPTTASHGDWRSGRLAECSREVVRDEERRQRHDDEEVEEQHPSGDETGQVVERPADERRRASGLGERRRALRIRERDEDEDRARDEEDERREPEAAPATMPSAM